MLQSKRNDLGLEDARRAGQMEDDVPLRRSLIAVPKVLTPTVVLVSPRARYEVPTIKNYVGTLYLAFGTRPQKKKNHEEKILSRRPFGRVVMSSDDLET